MSQEPTLKIAKKDLEDCDSVDLSVFTSIADDSAEALAKHEGELNLRGLTTLSDTAAELLSKCEGDLLIRNADLEARINSFKGNNDDSADETDGDDPSEAMEKAAAKVGLSREALSAKLDALAGMVAGGNLGLVSQMIALSKDAWLFEALLAGSKIDDGKLVPGVGLKIFGGYAEMVGLLAWAYAPADAEIDDSFEDKTEYLELKVEFTAENLEPIEACLQEHITPHFPSLNVTSEGELVLSGLTTLSDAAAESLSKHNGELHLSGLATLSDAAAESLSKHRGNSGFCA